VNRSSGFGALKKLEDEQEQRNQEKLENNQSLGDLGDF